MAKIRVEVVYALPHAVDAVSVELPEGATVGEAVAASRLIERHPDIVRCAFGVFGRAVDPARRVVNGERVEIYRPLSVDPKEARRRRAAKR